MKEQFPWWSLQLERFRQLKCWVVGAGVAGLQAIATAKRMGAVVFATDVRMASKEQVESLGGNF